MLRTTRFRYAVTLIQRGTVIDETKPILENITVTDNAWSRLSYLNKRDKTPGRHLRLVIVPGGCRGFTYKFVLQNPMTETAKTSNNNTEKFNNKKDAGCPSEQPGAAGDEDAVPPIGDKMLSEKAEEKSTEKKKEMLSKATEAAVQRAKDLAQKFEKEDTAATNSSDEVLLHYDDDIEFVNDACVASLEGPEAKDVDTNEKTREKFIIDEISMKKLKGAKIDFISNLRGMAFYVDGNENVDKSCACKLSFSMRGDE